MVDKGAERETVLLVGWCAVVRFQSATLKRALQAAVAPPPALYGQVQAARELGESMLTGLDHRIDALTVAVRVEESGTFPVPPVPGNGDKR